MHLGRTRLLWTTSIIAFALLTAAGCSSTPSPTETESASESSAPVESELDEMGQALVAVQASYDLFASAGMTETVTSGGDQYILSYDPSNPEFLAALYNVNFDDVIPVSEKEMFTIYAAWLFSQDGASKVALTPTGISITNDASTPFEVVIQDGLIVSGSALDGSWSGTFSYQPDPAVLAKLAAQD